MATHNRYLMCPPDYFEVTYVINPWMEGNLNRTSEDRVRQQWQTLHDAIASRAELEIVRPEAGLPDMPFTANAGLILEDKVVLSRFLHPERQGEERYFEEWFNGHGYKVFKLPREIPFEGAGDALLDREQRWLWGGYGHRSSLESHAYLAKWLEIEVLSLRLIDDRFYHLDTCFCPLNNGYVMYYPLAFDEPSRRLIARRVPEEKRIVVSERDAVSFACNAVNIGKTIILNQATPELQQRLEQVGFEVIQTELSEFLKAGGAAKCLTLRLDEPRLQPACPVPMLAQRTIQLEGHLLDSNLMSRVMDMIVESGGSFEILNFHAGARQQDSSRAELQVTAPSQKQLEAMVGALIDLGARLPAEETIDATLDLVQQDGVAPDDFYITTIYPAEVRVKGQWWPVQGHRMDAVVVVDESQEPLQVSCQLLRDLRVGQGVVCGVQGIRTMLRREGHSSVELSGMGATLVSERRVELVVEQLAWELHRVRDQGGKVVVVAGPAVVHSGGGGHLAQLLREEYVQGLLGGNALAVYDLEQAIYGTVRGVDLHRSIQVRGGQRHLLKTINKVRAAGGIAQTVRQGLVKSGIFYECVERRIPFLLSGAIGDNGPLPEAQMDLIKAQEEYRRLLQGAQLVLVLSSERQAPGISSMVPAGVKFYCADINPAIINRLADQRAGEAVGVVTDVTLFLSLLISQLHQL